MNPHFVNELLMIRIITRLKSIFINNHKGTWIQKSINNSEKRKIFVSCHTFVISLHVYSKFVEVSIDFLAKFSII